MVGLSPRNAMRRCPSAIRSPDGLGTPSLVVGDDRVELRGQRPPVDRDDGEAGSAVVVEVVLLPAGGHQDQAVDPARGQDLCGLPLAVGVLVDAGGDDDDAARTGTVLDRAQHGAAEVVAQVLHQRHRWMRSAGHAAGDSPRGCAGSPARRRPRSPVGRAPRRRRAPALTTRETDFRETPAMCRDVAHGGAATISAAVDEEVRLLPMSGMPLSSDGGLDNVVKVSL